MILKVCFLLIMSVAWEVAGVSYSNVYMSTGAGASPVEYLKYSPSAYNYEYPSSQVAQYNLAPVSYDYPLGQSYTYRTYPEQTIALSQATPSANYVTYGAPASVPYVYGRSDPVASYSPATSYSYVLVNDGAGEELKLSDGDVIHGGYSFVQPQGLVQYVADDNQGLNAILKTYISKEPVALTETVHRATVHHDSVHHAEPCHEAKSEALTAHESHEESHEGHHGGHEHHESHEEHEVSHESHHEGHEEHHDSHEARHGSHEGHHDSHEAHDDSHDGHHDSHEGHHDSHEGHHDSHEGHPESHEAHHESHEARHGSHEEIHEFILNENGHKDRIIVINEREGDLDLESEEHHETRHHEPEHGSYEHESHDEHESHEHHSEENEEPTHESHSHEIHEVHHTHEAIVEASHEPHESHEHHEVHVAQVPALGLPVANNVYISYNDFIKCIQAAMAKGNTHPLYAPVPKPISPLTYLVFNKPC